MRSQLLPCLGISMALLGAVSTTSVFAGPAAAQGRGTPSKHTARAAAQRAAQLLDRVERETEEWGTAAISELILLGNNEQFKIDYDQAAGEYVDKARKNLAGEAARSLQEALALSVAMGLGEEAAEGDLSAPEVDAGRAQDVLSSPKFTAPQGLRGGQALAVSESVALKVGFSNKLQELLLKYGVNPKDIPDTHQAFLGVFQVSLNPGWRTRSGYVADINVAVEYAVTHREKALLETARLETAPTAKKTADEEQASEEQVGRERAGDETDFVTSFSQAGQGVQSGRRQPMVISVFPLLESQVLDLRNSQRSQVAVLTALAASLQAAGKPGQARGVADYVRRLEFDAATRTPLPLISPYSDGTNFGYQILPALQALGDPANPRTKSEQVLHPVSFPAMVLFLCEKEELFQRDNDGTLGEAPLWTRIYVSVNARWVPVNRRLWFKRTLIDPWLHGAPFKRRTNARQFESAAHIDDALHELATITANANGTALATEVRARLRMLESLGGGRTRVAQLPTAVQSKPAARTSAPQPPANLTLRTTAAYLNVNSRFVLTGQHLTKEPQSLVRQVIVDSRACNIIEVKGNTLVAELPGVPVDPETLPCLDAGADPCPARRRGYEAPVTVVTAGGVTSTDTNAGLTLSYLPQRSTTPGVAFEWNDNGRPTEVTSAVLTTPQLTRLSGKVVDATGTAQSPRDVQIHVDVQASKDAVASE